MDDVGWSRHVAWSVAEMASGVETPPTQAEFWSRLNLDTTNDEPAEPGPHVQTKLYRARTTSWPCISA